MGGHSRWFRGLVCVFASMIFLKHQMDLSVMVPASLMSMVGISSLFKTGGWSIRFFFGTHGLTFPQLSSESSYFGLLKAKLSLGGSSVLQNSAWKVRRPNKKNRINYTDFWQEMQLHLTSSMIFLFPLISCFQVVSCESDLLSRRSSSVAAMSTYHQKRLAQPKIFLSIPGHSIC